MIKRLFTNKLLTVCILLAHVLPKFVFHLVCPHNLQKYRVGETWGVTFRLKQGTYGRWFNKPFWSLSGYSNYDMKYLFFRTHYKIYEN